MPIDGDFATELDQPEGQALPPEPPIDEKADISSWVDKWAPQGLPQWVDIMLRPRRTIRAIVNENPAKYWKRLAFLYGALAASIDIGLSGPSRLIAQVILGGLLGLLGVYLFTGITHLLGRTFRGKATLTEVLAASVWSRIPAMFAGLLWIGIEAVAWNLMRKSYMAAPPHTALDTVAGIAQVVGQVLFLWSTIIFLLTFAEVNRFSVWRSVGACLLPWLVFAICIGLVYIMISLQ